MSIKANFPSIRPSLNLDFANSKRLDPRITFSRASSGTYVDANGVIQTAAANVPRFDHDPATGESLGLLVEEQRTNIIVSSQSFSSGGWVVNGASLTANAATAPDGTATATSIVQGTGNNRIYHFDNSGVTGNKVFSVFAKANAGTSLSLGASGGVSSTATATINLSSGTVSGFTGATIQAYTNGWYRIALPVNVTNASGNATYWRISGPASSVYIWGAQLEAGTSSTSYIPTTSATVTRSADVASIVGANFSNWWNSASGTFHASFRSTLSGTRPVLSVDDNTANNRIELYTSASSQKFTVTTGGVAQADITAGTASSTAVNQQAAAYGSNDFSTSLAGATAVTDTSGTVPVVTQLRIGANQAGDSRTTPIARLAYYPARLTDAQLQNLTR